MAKLEFIENSKGKSEESTLSEFAKRFPEFSRRHITATEIIERNSNRITATEILRRNLAVDNNWATSVQKMIEENLRLMTNCTWIGNSD